MAEVKDIVFEGHWYYPSILFHHYDDIYIRTWSETKICFVAPKSYLNEKYTSESI